MQRATRNSSSTRRNARPQQSAPAVPNIRQAEGVRLTAERLAQARGIVDECRIAMLSFQRLASHAQGATPELRSAHLTAMANQAKWLACRSDVLLSLLDYPQGGDYADELAPAK